MIYIGPDNEITLKNCKQNNEIYEGKDKIIDYLKHGNVDTIRMSYVKDVFTGEKIHIEPLRMNDGEYIWWNILAYYVEKYNLELPKAFVDKILGIRN